MSDYQLSSEPYGAPDQVWAAAGWYVFVISKDAQVKTVIACHRASGKIRSAVIDADENKNWERATLHKIMGSWS